MSSLIVLTDPTTSTSPGAPDCFAQVHLTQCRKICLLICQYYSSHCNHQEIIIGDLNRCILNLTQDRGGPGRTLFESDSNKRWGHKTGHLQEITGVKLAFLEQIWQPAGTIRSILNPTQDWNGLGRDYYSSWTRTNAGGLKCNQYLSHFLGHY